MVSQQQLLRHRDFLHSLHRARTSAKVKCILEAATETELRILVAVIKAVVVQEIPLPQKRRALGRLKKVKTHLRRIAGSCRNLLRAAKPELLATLFTVLSVLRLILVPLFLEEQPSEPSTVARVVTGGYVSEEENCGAD